MSEQKASTQSSTFLGGSYTSAIRWSSPDLLSSRLPDGRGRCDHIKDSGRTYRARQVIDTEPGRNDSGGPLKLSL